VKRSVNFCAAETYHQVLSSVCFPFHIQGQRTVYRLTLVKEWNTEELEAYASLVAKGNPDFIEIKVLPPWLKYLITLKGHQPSLT